jgi:hypothetical protein
MRAEATAGSQPSTTCRHGFIACTHARMPPGTRVACRQDPDK